MISVDGVQKSTIRSHYQLGTVFYRLLWGPHIHHGLWEADESVYQAQCQLTDALADMSSLAAGQTVVDIGCGMGGSSIRLAKRRDCDVTGVTISPVQCRWARTAARINRVARKTHFIAADADKSCAGIAFTKGADQPGTEYIPRCLTSNDRNKRPSVRPGWQLFCVGHRHAPAQSANNAAVGAFK